MLNAIDCSFALDSLHLAHSIIADAAEEHMADAPLDGSGELDEQSREFAAAIALDAAEAASAEALRHLEDARRLLGIREI